MKPLEEVILAAGFTLAFAAGLSLLYCVVLVGSAVSKGYSVFQFVGYWPLLTVVLLLLSGCLILGAEPLARAIGKKKSDEHKSGSPLPPEQMKQSIAKPAVVKDDLRVLDAISPCARFAGIAGRDVARIALSDVDVRVIHETKVRI